MSLIGRPRPTGVLMMLVLLALVLRLGLVLHGHGRPLVGDEVSYDDIAWNLATGHGYETGHSDAERHVTAVRGPAYVCYLAAFYRPFGHRPILPILGQLVFEAVSCLLAYRIAVTWFGRSDIGLMAVGLFAVYPPFILNAATLGPESLTTAMMLTTIAGFLAYVARPRARHLFLSGVALGVCALNKPQLGPIGMVLPMAALPRLGWRRALLSAATIVLVTAIVMAPWIVRNAIVYRAFIPGVTNGGISFWGGTAPIAGRCVGGLGDPWVPDSLRRALSRMGEQEANRWYFHDARRVIMADPGAYAWLSLRKFFRLWFNVGYEDPPSKASILLALFNLMAYALAVLGARRAHPDPVGTRTVVALVILFTLVSVPFDTVFRYAVPCLPAIFCFTAAGLIGWRAPGRLAETA